MATILFDVLPNDPNFQDKSLTVAKNTEFKLHVSWLQANKLFTCESSYKIKFLDYWTTTTSLNRDPCLVLVVIVAVG